MRALLIFAASAAVLAQQPSKIDYKCTDEDGPVYLELASADAVPGRIIATGNLHTDSATLASVLLTSTDDGRTWTEAHERIPEAALEQIQFVDLQNGWISGQTVRTLPRDPFFLVTRDGGKTWKQRPIWEEPRTGVVDRFFFESKDNGSMIVDLVSPNETGGRYELYRTQTGGDSWALEQVSAKPLSLKRAASVSAWRVHADAKSKVYAVEKGGAEGAWERVASFPIEVAKCHAE